MRRHVAFSVVSLAAVFAPPQCGPSTTPNPTTTTRAPVTTLTPATTTPATSVAPTVAPTTVAPTTVAPATSTTAAPATTVLPAGVLWSETFATPASMNRLVTDIHFGDNVANGNAMQSFNGDHNHACNGPTTGRPLIENYQTATHFWHCAPAGPDSGHFMTGVNTLGYVILAFAPAAPDGSAQVFPATADRVCWDQNLTELGGRKWTQLIVVGADRFRANGGGLNYINPDFTVNGGASALPLAGDDFLFVNLRNSVQFFSGQTKTYVNWSGLFGVTDKATRYTICVTDNRNGTVTRTQARPGGVVSTVTGPGAFPAGPRVFIIEDDSYNPMKSYRDEGVTQAVADPFTWHWDNIIVSAVG